MTREELASACRSLAQVGGVYAWLAGVVWRENEGATDA